MYSLYKKYLESVKKWIWKTVDYDKAYANQCVDFIRQYAKDIGKPITTYGNATDFIKKWLWPNWERVKEWQVADIGIQQASKSLPYGHIFVVESISDKVYVIEQNRDGKAFKNNDPKNLWSPVSRGSYPKKWIVFFRAK